jgi:hypothetical protein
MTNDEDLRQRMFKMAENLLVATKDGKISWRLTDAEDKFIYAGSRSSVTIELHTDRFEGDETVLSLLNSRGVVVDSLETAMIRAGEEGFMPAPHNVLLDDLYHAARRVAHSVDEALDSMFEDIEKGTPSPPAPEKKKRGADPWASSDEPPF